jgi:hypothetical protein
MSLLTYVTVLFFEEARKNACFEKNASFFGDRGFPLAAPEGGSTLREQGQSFLFVMKTKL